MQLCNFSVLRSLAIRGQVLSVVLLTTGFQSTPMQLLLNVLVILEVLLESLLFQHLIQHIILNTMLLI